MGGKAKKTESSSTLPRIGRHLPQPSIKHRVGQYESSDEEDDPNIIAELLAKQASPRAELRVLDDDLEEKTLRLGTSVMMLTSFASSLILNLEMSLKP